MKKNNENSYIKRKIAENMIASINDKYIKQAEKYKVQEKKNNKVIIFAKIAAAACFVIALVWVAEMKTGNNSDINNNRIVESKTAEISANERLHLATGKNGEKILAKGMEVNVGKYNFSIESSKPGIPIIITDSKNQKSKITVKSDSGIIRVEKNGYYENVKKETTISSGQTIFWSPDSKDKSISEVIVCLFENEKIVSGVVVNIFPDEKSNYIVKYADNVKIIDQYNDIKGKLEAVKASQYDMEKDLQRGAVPEDKLEETKLKNTKYKKFINKYKDKLDQLKNNEKLEEKFINEYNKLTK